jgi:hypothetical protein
MTWGAGNNGARTALGLPVRELSGIGVTSPERRLRVPHAFLNEGNTRHACGNRPRQPAATRYCPARTRGRSLTSTRSKDVSIVSTRMIVVHLGPLTTADVRRGGGVHANKRLTAATAKLRQAKRAAPVSIG